MAWFCFFVSRARHFVCPFCRLHIYLATERERPPPTKIICVFSNQDCTLQQKTKKVQAFLRPYAGESRWCCCCCSWSKGRTKIFCTFNMYPPLLLFFLRTDPNTFILACFGRVACLGYWIYYCHFCGCYFCCRCRDF